MRSGDHILQIGEVNVGGMGSEQVAQVLRKVGQHVKLVIARLVTDDSNIDASSTAEVINKCNLANLSKLFSPFTLKNGRRGISSYSFHLFSSRKVIRREIIIQ